MFISAFPDTIYPLTVSISKNLTGKDLTSISAPASQLLEYRGWLVFDFPDVQPKGNQLHCLQNIIKCLMFTVSLDRKEG
ncbi:MAG TPA: hypothetical protein EYP23_05995 [Thermoplasmata archaeon]|nr:hypothetical protein [Thermoplasmata archaeon]